MDLKYYNFPLDFMKDFMQYPQKSLSHITQYVMLCRACAAARLLEVKKGPKNTQQLSMFDVMKVYVNAADSQAANAWLISAFKFYVDMFKAQHGRQVDKDRDFAPKDIHDRPKPTGYAMDTVAVWNSFQLQVLYWEDYCKNHDQRPVMTGISAKVLKVFQTKETTNNERALLMMHLAIHSIIGNVGYKKITRDFILARMCCYRQVSDGQLTDDIAPYSTRTRFEALRSQLYEKWGLAYYGKGTRGTYYSYKLKIPELIEKVEDNKVKRRSARQKDDYRKAVEEALAAYNETHPMPTKSNK